MTSPSKLKPLFWVGSAKEDLKALPTVVMSRLGFGLYLAQAGGKHPHAKALRGFGSAGVVEIVEDWSGNTYRAVYTVQFAGSIYVLHVFQKKSKHGVETPKADMALIKNRLKAARSHEATS